jgi:RHS repeat-associated protein
MTIMQRQAATRGFGGPVSGPVFAALGLAAAVWSLPAVAASETRVSSWTYDAAGMIATETIEPDTAQLTLTTAYTYDAFGNKTAVTVSSPATGTAAIASRTTSTTYTSDGRFPATVTNALSQSESRVYDAKFGTLTSQTGPNGLTTTWSYDSFGRKILETRPDGTRTKWEYLWCSGYNGGTLSGCPTLARYAIRTTPLASDGSTQIGPKSLQYMDALEREIRVETQGYASSGDTAHAIYADTEYDSYGRVYRKSRPYYAGDTAVWTSFEYDAIGRVIRENRPQEENGSPVVKQVNITYAGLVTTVTNEWNEQRITTKNSQGQTVLVKNGRDDASTQVFTVNQYTYDPFGNLKTVFDQDGNTVSFAYDKRGRKTAMADPDKGAWSYEYDALGQLKRQTDAKGQVTEISYDLLGRTLSKVAKTAAATVEQTDSFVYDTAPYGIGKLASATATDGSSTVIHSRSQVYDSLGRPNQTVLSQGGNTSYFTQSYDSYSRLSTLNYPSGLTLDYAYSSLSELLTVSTGGNAVWTLNTRNAARQLTGETYGNGVAGARSYEAGRGLVQTITASKAGTTLQSWSIGYDSVGNVTRRAESVTGVVDTIDYDPLNRLIAASATTNGNPATTLTMQYLGGNITYKSDVGSYSYPAAGSGAVRPHAVTGITSNQAGIADKAYTYDANGNMLTGDGRTLTWNAFDMPVSISRGGNTVGFAYDADHQRIQQTTPSDIKQYLTDAATGARAERKLSTAGAHLRWDSYIVIGGELVSLVTKEANDTVVTRYFHRDHLSSTTLLTDEAGNVVERLSYDVWGKRRFTTGAADFSDSITSQVDRGYTGHEMLEEVALIHMNGRLYDATIARMVSADPMVSDPLSALAFNRFAYVDNNPCTYIDPTGYLKWGRIFRSVAAIVVAVVLMQPEIGLVAFAGNFGAAVIAGAAAGAISSGSLKGAVIGGISGGLFAGLDSVALSLTKGMEGIAAGAVRGAVYGMGGGALSVAQGGKFGAGFLAAGFSAALGPTIESIKNIALRAAAGAIAGGLGSILGGGKFENGAVTGAFTQLFKSATEAANDNEQTARSSSSKGQYNSPSVKDTSFDTADVTINLFPDAANGFGHVGIGVNTNQTMGFYPADGASKADMLLGKDVPGVLKADDLNQRYETIILKTTPEQDQAVQDAIDYRAANPGNYNLYNRNCAVFCVDGLTTGGQNASPTVMPRKLFNSLKRAE